MASNKEQTSPATESKKEKNPDGKSLKGISFVDSGTSLVAFEKNPEGKPFLKVLDFPEFVRILVGDPSLIPKMEADKDAISFPRCFREFFGTQRDLIFSLCKRKIIEDNDTEFCKIRDELREAEDKKAKEEEELQKAKSEIILKEINVFKRRDEIAHIHKKLKAARDKLHDAEEALGSSVATAPPP